MTPREQALLNSIKATVAKDLYREIVQLKRKVSRIIAQRDEWKENAHKYRKTVLERNQK